MGALVTVELADDAPERDLPWIITFGPLDEESAGWDPVVCGPYERLHALALAQEVVADEELMAVVEPVQPKTSVDAIRAEITAAQAMGYAEPAEFDDSDDLDEDIADDEIDGLDDSTAEPPSPRDIQDGFARIFDRLRSAG